LLTTIDRLRPSRRRLRALTSPALAVLALALGLAAGTAYDVPVTAAATAAPAAGAAAPAAAEASPFAGTALWITQVPATASPEQLAGEARAAGAGTLFVKAADGSTPELQLSPALLGGLRAAGERVCAWTFAYGEAPRAEAAVAVAAVRAGAECLVLDAEGQYEGRYGAAQAYMRALRSALGARFPIGLAGQAEVLEHQCFPYSVFLGPGGASFDLPQMYWLELGLGVEAAYAATIPVNAIYGRPMAPVGQVFGAPSASELGAFRALAGAYGLAGTSFFDLDAAQPGELAALAAQPPRLARRAIGLPTLRAGADGDEIVWAQELLNAVGARLPVGGFYGAQTERALARFQGRHRLRANGVLGPATWLALLRLHPREPSWAKAPPLSAGECHTAAG
jgi:Putative peptidoglycan binding domain